VHCANLLLRKLQIHRQKVLSEQQRTTKRRAPAAPTSPALSSSLQAAEAGLETGKNICFAISYLQHFCLFLGCSEL